MASESGQHKTTGLRAPGPGTTLAAHGILPPLRIVKSPRSWYSVFVCHTKHHLCQRPKTVSFARNGD
eukprot:scaffold1365_cov163-Ochromonas_danica.AAC.12